MAPNVTVSFYEANDINGSPLLTIDDEDQFFKGLTITPDLYGLGGWELTLARNINFALFGSGAVQPEVFVRILVHAYSDTDWFYGGVLQKRQQDVINRDEAGAEEFVFGGPGPKAYMERYRLGTEQLSGGGSWLVDLINGVWAFNESATAGRVLNRLVAEDAAAANPALPDLTSTFDQTDDSNGNPWTDIVATDGTFELPIGNSLLQTIWDLEDLADLYTVIDLGTVASPKYELNAYETFGTDASGTDPGIGICILREGLNIANDSLTVTGVAMKKASHVIVEGKDGAWATTRRPSWSSGDYVKWEKISYPRSSSEVILEKAGIRWLQRQTNGFDQLTVEIVPGADEAAGYYFPGPASVLWVGNTITLDTTADGSTHSPLDYNNSPQLVSGLEITLGPAGDDATADKQAKSWDIKVRLNGERAGFASSPNQTSAATAGTCNCPRLHHPPVCDPIPAGAVETELSSSDDDPSLWPGSEDASGSCWGGVTHEAIGGSGGQTSTFTVAAGDLVYGRLLFQEQTGNDPWENVDNYAYVADLQFSDVGASLPILVYPIVHQLYHNAGCISATHETVQEVPTGYNRARIVFRFRLGGTRYRGWIGTLTSTEPIECPPFSVGSDVPMESPYYYPSDTVDSLLDSHTHPQGLIEDSQTAETDDTLVLAPDGAGGVEFRAEAGGSGAPSTVNYLVGTADAGLSAEIVVGTTPGGELGGTWASPTVDATHSGSAHHTENHASRHADAGADPVDVTGLDGFPGGTTNYLRADGTFNDPLGGGVTVLGFASRAVQNGASINNLTLTSGATLAANGGSVAMEVLVPAPMNFDQVRIRVQDASGARAWRWDLYVQTGSTNVLTRVAASNGSDSYTAAGAAVRTLGAASAPVVLSPGIYWMVVQCTHATQVLNISTATAVSLGALAVQTKTTGNPNGSTLDFTAATWTKQLWSVAMVMDGRVFGQGAAF